MQKLLTTGIMLLLLSGPVLAGSAARVATLQSPVWLERQYGLTPLGIGDQLSDGDTVVTGKDARVVLNLADGSQLKLGENARFEVAELQSPKQEGGILSGVMNVLKGAFRFTTGLIGKRYQRDLKIRVSTATIGIRGTDVWGKAEDTRDFVLLLEGSIAIERNGETVEMSDPMTLYMAPKNQPVQPLQGASSQQIAVWSEETEPQAGKGVRREDGRWRLQLASYRSRAEVNLVQQRLASEGISSGNLQVTVDGHDWQRLFVDKFASRADAEYRAEQLSTRYAFSSPWLQQQP